MNYILKWIAGCRNSLVQATGDQLAKRNATRDEFPTIAPSLATIRRDARFVAVDGRAADLSKLAEFRRLTGLWVEHASTKDIELIGTLRGLQSLLIWELKTAAIGPIAGLRQLRHLVLWMANKVGDLKPIAGLTKLEALFLRELRHVTDLSALSRLTRLRDLQVVGGLWSKFRVRSLSPLANLTKLEYVYMASMRVKDSALSPIVNLRRLRYIGMENVFPVEECAAVAGALPNARGRILRPVFSETLFQGVGVCRKCHGTLVPTTGKPSKILCPTCDRAKLEHHITRWKALVAKAAA